MQSGFIANANPPAEPDKIASAPFWPEIEVAAIRRTVRIEGEVTNERLRAMLVDAILVVNDDLRDFQAAHEAAGAARLADVPAPKIDGKSRLVLLYTRAVACAVLAEIAERYRSFDATNSGNERADVLTPSIDEARRDLRWALNDLRGKRRSVVELI